MVVLQTEFQNFTNSLTQMSLYLNMEDSFGHEAMLYLLGAKQSFDFVKRKDVEKIVFTPGYPRDYTSYIMRPTIMKN